MTVITRSTQPPVASVSGVPTTASLEAQWDELADHLGAAPFARPGWLKAWYTAFGGTGEAITVTVRHAGLRAVAPLIRTRKGLVAPVNGETPRFDLLATEVESRTRLAREILGGWNPSATMLRVPSGDVDVLDSAAAWARRRVVKEPMQRSPFIAIDGSWDDYESTLNKKFRKDLKRRARRLAEEGDFSVEVRDGTERLAELLDEGFAVEALGWKGDEGTAIQAKSPTERFYRDVSAWAAERGWLRMWFLRLDGKAIAFCLDIDDGHAYYGLKVAHDPAWAKVSPGMILQDETVKYAFEQGLASFEFLGNDEPYKLKWTKTCRELWAWRAYARGPRGTTGWVNRTVIRPAARKVKR